MTLRTIDYLRHRPPFLFIDEFELLNDGACAVLSREQRRAFAKRSARSVFWFDIECAAQLFGCFCRADTGEKQRPGYLSSYNTVAILRDTQPVSLSVSEVEFTPTFRRFSAQWLDDEGQQVMIAEGTIALPKGGVLSTQTAIRNDADFETPIFAPEGDQQSAWVDWAFDPADDIFKGHFPDDPVVPGILLGERLSELALWAYPGTKITKISHMIFASPVFPGQSIRLSFKQRGSVLSAMVMNSGTRAARAKITLGPVNPVC